MTLIYLDQNYASRLAKFLLGQKGHEPFGVLYEVLRARARELLIPPSPFHVLELRGGYLLPTFQEMYAAFSHGYWVRPWQEVLARQVASGELRREDLLTRRGSWQEPADLTPLGDVLTLALAGDFLARSWAAQEALKAHLGLKRSTTPPFVRLLARFVAFRSLELDRYPRASDLTDLVMAATVGPYVDVLATDRYQRELMQRAGFAGRVYSGSRREVAQLAADLRGAR